MLYLVQQIVLCLLFTALIGAAVGWLLRGMGSSRQGDMIAAQWRAKLERLESKQAATAADDAGATAAPDAETEALRLRLANSERELATLRTARAVRDQAEDESSAQDELRETRLVCQQLQARVAEQRTLNEQLKKRAQISASERETLVERLRDLETRFAQLNQERRHATDTVAGLQKELRRLQAAQTATGPEARTTAGPEARTTAGPEARTTARPEARTTAGPEARTTAGPEARTRAGPGATKSPGRPDSGRAPERAPATAAQPRPAAAPKTASGPASKADDTQAQQRLPITDTSPPPAAARPYEPAWRLRAPDGAPDNLQAVYGIGPKIEHRLNQLGIFHFRQIAAFEEADIHWVAAHLQSFPGRILRDRWVEQARSLEKRRRAGQPI